MLSELRMDFEHCRCCTAVDLDNPNLFGYMPCKMYRTTYRHDLEVVRPAGNVCGVIWTCMPK